MASPIGPLKLLIKGFGDRILDDATRGALDTILTKGGDDLGKNLEEWRHSTIADEATPENIKNLLSSPGGKHIFTAGMVDNLGKFGDDFNKKMASASELGTEELSTLLDDLSVETSTDRAFFNHLEDKLTDSVNAREKALDTLSESTIDLRNKQGSSKLSETELRKQSLDNYAKRIAEENPDPDIVEEQIFRVKPKGIEIRKGDSDFRKELKADQIAFDKLKSFNEKNADEFFKTESGFQKLFDEFINSDREISIKDLKQGLKKLENVNLTSTKITEIEAKCIERINTREAKITEYIESAREAEAKTKEADIDQYIDNAKKNGRVETRESFEATKSHKSDNMLRIDALQNYDTDMVVGGELKVGTRSSRISLLRQIHLDDAVSEVVITKMDRVRLVRDTFKAKASDVLGLNNNGPVSTFKKIEYGNDGKPLPTDIIPKWIHFAPERVATALVDPKSAISSVYRSIATPFSSLGRFAIGRRFFRPVIKNIDEAVKNSGVRNAVIELQGDLARIKHALENNAPIDRKLVTKDNVAEVIQNRFDTFINTGNNKQNLAQLDDYLLAVRNEITLRGSADDTGKYNGVTGWYGQHNDNALRYVNDLRSMTASLIEGRSGAFAKELVDEVNELTGKGVKSPTQIGNIMGVMIDNRFGRLGTDVLLRETQKNVARDAFGAFKMEDGGFVFEKKTIFGIEVDAKAHGMDVQDLERRLENWNYNQYTYKTVAGDYGDGNGLQHGATLMALYVQRMGPDNAVAWGVDGLQTFTDNVISLTSLGKWGENLVMDSVDFLNHSQGSSVYETVPTQFISKAKGYAEDLADGYEKQMWENIYHKSFYKYDTPLEGGAREINTRMAQKIKEIMVYNRAETYSDPLRAQIMQLGLSKPAAVELKRHLWNEGMNGLAFVTGGTTELASNSNTILSKIIRTKENDDVLVPRWNLFSTPKPKDVSVADWEKLSHNEKIEKAGDGSVFYNLFWKRPVDTALLKVGTNWPIRMNPIASATVITGTGATLWTGGRMAHAFFSDEEATLGDYGHMAAEGLYTAALPSQIGMRIATFSGDFLADDLPGMALKKYFGRGTGWGEGGLVPYGELVDKVWGTSEDLLFGKNKEGEGQGPLAFVESTKNSVVDAISPFMTNTQKTDAVNFGKGLQSNDKSQAAINKELDTIAAADANKTDNKAPQVAVVADSTLRSKTPKVVASSPGGSPKDTGMDAEGLEINNLIIQAGDRGAANEAAANGNDDAQASARLKAQEETAEANGVTLTTQPYPLAEDGKTPIMFTRDSLEQQQTEEQQQTDEEEQTAEPKWVTEIKAQQAVGTTRYQTAVSLTNQVSNYADNDSKKYPGAKQIVQMFKDQETSVNVLIEQQRAEGNLDSVNALTDLKNEYILTGLADAEAQKILIDNMLIEAEKLETIALKDKTTLDGMNLAVDNGSTDAKDLLDNITATNMSIKKIRDDAAGDIVDLRKLVDESNKGLKGNLAYDYDTSSTHSFRKMLLDATNGSTVLESLIGEDKADGTPGLIEAGVKSVFNGAAAGWDGWQNMKRSGDPTTQKVMAWSEILIGGLAGITLWNSFVGPTSWPIKLAVGAIALGFLFKLDGKYNSPDNENSSDNGPRVQTNYGASSRAGNVPHDNTSNKGANADDNKPTEYAVPIKDRDGNPVDHVMFKNGVYYMQQDHAGNFPETTKNIVIDAAVVERLNSGLKDHLVNTHHITPNMAAGGGNNIPDEVLDKLTNGYAKVKFGTENDDAAPAVTVNYKDLTSEQVSDIVTAH